jgi:hypothetical protein
MVRDNQSGENDNLNKVIHNIEIELGWNMGKKIVVYNFS